MPTEYCLFQGEQLMVRQPGQLRYPFKDRNEQTYLLTLIGTRACLYRWNPRSGRYGDWSMVHTAPLINQYQALLLLQS